MSIWKKDLLDNPFGRFLTNIVLPLFLMGVGIHQIVTQRATLGRLRFVYHGFDAILVGAGVICLGISIISLSGFSVRLAHQSKTFPLIGWIALGTAVVCLATAALRNIF